jgi:CDP-glucose 4,6-dehydratase
VSEFWSNRRVLVTGSCGLMGGELCQLLLDEGADVVGFDAEPPGTLVGRGLDGRFPVVEGDILNLHDLSDAMKAMDVVFHLAAISGVEHARKLGLNALEINVAGTWNVLETCRGLPIEAVVIASSNHVYGTSTEKPTYESEPLKQLDMYSTGKIAADYVARAYAHNYGVPTVIMRNTNCFGPHDPHRDHIIAATIASVLAGKRPVIKGTGTTEKSYLHVRDVVRGYLGAAEWAVRTKKKGEVFNLSRQPITVLGLVKTILEVMGSNLEPIVLGEENDQANEYLSSQKAAEAFGWRAGYALAAAIKDTVDWMVQQQVETH